MGNKFFDRIFKKKVIGMGQSEKIVICIGHSHIEALRQAYINREDQFKFKYKFARYQGSNKILMDETLMPLEDFYKSLQRERCDLLLCLGGNAHNNLAITKIYNDYKFLLDGEMYGEPNSQFIPIGQIEYRLMSQGGWPEVIEEYKRIRENHKGRIYNLISTPPIESNEFIETNAGPLKELIGKYGVMNSSVRLGMWKLNKKLTERIVSELEIKTLPLPNEIFNARGFLHESILINDPTHAGGKFGEHILESFEKGAEI
jgi:hypothetical protein